MSTARRDFNALVARARADAFEIVRKEVRSSLPKGWVMFLGVGWGLTIFDDTGKTVIGIYTDAPERLPKGLRKAGLIAADFCDTFGYGNEEIRSAMR